MAQRRFGPTLGAGVVVIEQEADKILEPAALGVTSYIGILERGDTGTLLSTFSKNGMAAKIGSRIPGSLVPDAGQDFWDLGQGAGELHFIRVTDGTERAASLVLYDREAVSNQVARIRAHNGGRWASRYQTLIGVIASPSAALTATTIATGVKMAINEWAGGQLILNAVQTQAYTIIGNTADGVISVQSDMNVKADFGAATDGGFQLLLPRDATREITVQIGDGEIDPANEWSLQVYLNGNPVLRYGSLSMDPNAPRYFVNMINDDQGNDLILVDDLNAPASVTPAKRPANEFGLIQTLTALTLTRNPMQLKVTNSPGGANPTVAASGDTDAMRYHAQLVVTMTSATDFSVTCPGLGHGAAMGTGTLGTAFIPDSPVLPKFTLSNGSVALASGDTLLLEWLPFIPGALVGALVYPDKTKQPLKAFRIASNDHKSVTINAGDMTTVGAVGGQFAVVWPQPLGGSGAIGGYDGIAGVTDANFVPHLDPASTELRSLIGQNKGLVKVACPGRTTTTVQKAGLTFAEAMNWQYRVEIPDTVLTEDAAINYINGTIGRSDMGVVSFPSYGDVDNPDASGTLKRVTLTGMIHGREALVAKNFGGYHKAAAGTDVTLPRVLRLPATNLNEEQLNPVGINVIKWNKGNVIVWGDRTISVDPAWKFKHQRELMSHYENQLRESFDFIVFAINDEASQAVLLTSLRAFFLPEFTKRALRGAKFEDSCRIKIDDDINTNLTRANGELNAEITLRLADTVERFIIRIGKAGIFESLS
jgi:hypothetical protein